MFGMVEVAAKTANFLLNSYERHFVKRFIVRKLFFLDLRRDDSKKLLCLAPIRGHDAIADGAA